MDIPVGYRYYSTLSIVQTLQVSAGHFEDLYIYTLEVHQDGHHFTKNFRYLKWRIQKEAQHFDKNGGVPTSRG